MNEGLNLNMKEKRKQSHVPERLCARPHEGEIKLSDVKGASDSTVISLIDMWLARALAHQIAGSSLRGSGTEALSFPVLANGQESVSPRKNLKRNSGKLSKEGNNLP